MNKNNEDSKKKIKLHDSRCASIMIAWQYWNLQSIAIKRELRAPHICIQTQFREDKNSFVNFEI